MKLRLLTLSVVTALSAAAVAHAESSVTLYGNLDAGLGFYNSTYSDANKTVKKTTIGYNEGVTTGNNFGLKGSEDLGNGTSAIFQIESGFSLGSGVNSNGLFGNKSLIGLSGDSWGTFTLGNQGNVADDFMPGFSSTGTDYGQGGARGSFGGSLTSGMQNSVKYKTPVMGGFSGGIAWSGSNKVSKTTMGGTTTESRDGNKNWISTGALYDGGPLRLGASYDHIKQAGTDSSINGWNLGASYDFGAAKLGLLYGQERNGTIGGLGSLPAGLMHEGQGSGDLKADALSYYGTHTLKGAVSQSWALGVTVPTGDNGRVKLSYSGNRIKGFNNLNGEVSNTLAPSVGVVKTNILSAVYNYDLSKRTAVYAAASMGKAKSDNISYKSNFVALGMNHHF